jgi:hypothetical protein
MKMLRYYKGMATGLALGTVAAMAVVATMDPRISNRLVRKGRCLVRDCKRKWMDIKDMQF